MLIDLQYDVALSFSGAQRAEAGALAAEIERRGILVFYDKNEEARLWGKNLSEALEEIYAKQSRVCVILVSKEYAASSWPIYEKRVILSRARQEEYEYVLPVRFDDTHLPGLSEDIASVSWSTPENVADVVKQKILEIAAKANSNDDRRFSLEGTLERLQDWANRTKRYNILLLGKAGVGKSSLINYLFSKPLRPVGAGSSVTPFGFHPQDELLEGVPVSIFDSEGIDLFNVERWKLALSEELARRSSVSPVESWFHTIIYCIGAGGSRIDPVDVQIVRQLLETNHGVIVAFTKSDQCTEEDIQELRECLFAETGRRLANVSICSLERKLRGGTIFKFGVEELQKRILDQAWASIQNRLPARCVALLGAVINEWARSQKEHISKTVTIFSSRKKCFESIHSEFDSLKRQIAEGDEFRSAVKGEIQHAVDNYAAILQLVGIQFVSDSESLDGMDLDLPESSAIVDDLFGENTWYEMMGLMVAPLALTSVPILPIALIPVALALRGNFLRSSLDEAVDKLATSLSGRLDELQREIDDKISKALASRGPPSAQMATGRSTRPRA